MRIKEQSSIHNAAHPDEEIYRAASRIVRATTFELMDEKLREAVNMVIDDKRRQLLIDNLNKNGIYVQ